MANYLITGVSSGIGRVLTQQLIHDGHYVWGIARRKKLLINLAKELHSSRFKYSIADISQEKFWERFIIKLKSSSFVPHVVILNAAVASNDFLESIDINILNQTFQINFFANIMAVQKLVENYKKKMQIILISSSSAFKGNFHEGIGYSASKAAISVAFESLFQKYHHTNKIFTTIYFGPIYTEMNRFKKAPPLALSKDRAVQAIIKATKEKKYFYYYPMISIFLLRATKLFLPTTLFLKLFSFLEKHYNKS